MRRLFLLAALCMVGALVFAPTVMAQAPSQGEPISLGSETEPCPNDLAEVQAAYGPNVECAEGGGYAYASAIASASSSASADPCPAPDFPRATPDGCQASDLPDVSFSVTASATAEADDESATATASTSEDVVEILPATGGPAFALMLAPAALLLAGGLVALRVVRRS